MNIQLRGMTGMISYSELDQAWINSNRNCDVIIDNVLAGRLTCTESKVTVTVTDNKYHPYLEHIAEDILTVYPIVDLKF